MKRSTIALLLATAGLTAFPQFASAQPKPAPAKPQPAAVSSPAPAQPEFPTDRLVRADGARVVPDKFLRAWDPITIFFDTNTGPTA